MSKRSMLARARSRHRGAVEETARPPKRGVVAGSRGRSSPTAAKGMTSPRAVPVLRHVRRARARGGRRRWCVRLEVERRAVEPDRAARRRGACRRAPRGARTGRCRRRRRCRRSRRPRTAKRRPSSRAARRVCVDDRQVLDLEHERRRAGAAVFSTRSSTRRPTISSASSAGLVSAVSSVATISPRRMTMTSSVTAMISRSLWVMRMMVLPWLLRRARMRKRCVGLGRGQHAGRLVEDQDVGARGRAPSGSRPAAAARPRARRRRRRDRRRARSRASSRCQLGPRRGERRASSAPSSAPSMTFSSTVKRLDQHEVLVDHADAGPDRRRLASGSACGLPSTRISPESAS